MAASTFDFERIAVLEQASEEIEQVKVTLRKGMDGYNNIAREVGAENLNKVAASQEQATQNMIDFTQSWLESNEAVIAHYKAVNRVQEA